MGRFINADAFASTGQGILGNNMFTYCLNNPMNYLDPEGNRVVGIGFQGDVQGGGTSVGVEIVVYFDPEVCGDADYLVTAYTYSGYEVSPGQLDGILDLIDTAALAYLADNQSLEHDALMAMARTAVYGANLSGGVFLIDGYDNFDDIGDYSGAFETWAFSMTPSSLSGTVFHATSATCQAVGLKFGVGFNGIKSKRMLPYELSYSKTEYSDPIVLMEGYW